MEGDAQGPYRTGGREARSPAAATTAAPAWGAKPALALALPSLVCVGLCLAGLAPWSSTEPVFIVSGLIAAVLRVDRDHRHAKATIATLPFPIHHDPPGAGDRPAPFDGICEVRIQLVDRLAGATADDRAVEAAAQVEGLRVTMLTDDAAILLTGWRRKHDDVATLTALLDTWGRQVHADAGIAEVRVTWRSEASAPEA